VWWIAFDPGVGSELRKIRPAVVLNIASVGKLPLRIVVPITEWRAKWAQVPWIVPLERSAQNGLAKDSAADCFQVKSLSLERFQSKMGALIPSEVEEIAAGVALCVGAV
jgi:mRNA interferase MazF